jgi:hypothetical protein
MGVKPCKIKIRINVLSTDLNTKTKKTKLKSFDLFVACFVGFVHLTIASLYALSLI